MRYNLKHFLYIDLIGVFLYGKHKFNPTFDQFQELGIVVDESKHTLLIQKGPESKTYIKNQYVFQCWLPQPDGTKKLLEFDGEKIVGNPENRIKNIRKIRRKYH